ncbi:MAG: nucleotide sugar dehydrogenase [Bacteroidales bacterium]|nr:nucleotide sugar dehydrogenase [Bacteroidales bacterium]
MYNQLISNKLKLAVVGLGYVGLPLALEFAKKMSVIGFDINERNLKMLRNSQDPSEELGPETFENRNIIFTSDPEELKKASFYIVAVPTPIDKYNTPDLKPLLSATLSVAKVLKKGDYVIYESTVYPGCTEEECVPLLESVSGLKFIEDFKVGYSPERINPGDAEHSLQKTIKIVSGCDDVSLDIIAKVYETVVEAGVHRAPGMKVAEAAKIIENTQRDVNIALMNELSILFNRMGINTYDVINAAATKWNFVAYTPGLVGGHCIGVDPYYMVHKASELKYHPQMIASGRFVNDSMGGYIAKQTVKRMLAGNQSAGIQAGDHSAGIQVGDASVATQAGIQSPAKSRVLIMGVTYKENVSDIRNSKVADIVYELLSYKTEVDVIDPKADPAYVDHEYGIKMVDKPTGKYNAIIMAVPHKEYRSMTQDDFKALLVPHGLVVDIRGVFRNIIKDLDYWSL